jgi:PAS domain S-box-containing protein
LEASEAEHKRAEEALRESEERYRTLIENANDIIYTHDLEGKFTSINPAATRVYGYTTEEILQLNIAQIVAPDYLPLARQKIREKLEGSPRTEPYELLTYSKEGEPIWVEVSTRLLEREGRPVGVQGIARDITERKRAEEALRESESRLRSILSSMVDLVFVFNNEGRFIFYHCPSLDLLYMPPEKFMGKKHSEIMPPYVDKLFVKAFNKNKKGEVAEYECWLEVSGETKWYSVKLSPMLLDDEFAGSVAVIRDITERKRAEEGLREVKEFSDDLIASMQDGFSVLDSSGVHIDVNSAFCQMTGFSREELIGVGPPHPYWPPEAYEEIERTFQKTLRGEFANLELTFMRKNGERFPVIVSPSWIKDKEGNVISYFATVKDITERKRAEEALRESHENYKGLADSIADVFFAMDKNLRYTYWNRASEDLTGISAKDAIGKYLYELFPDTPQTRRAERVYLDVLRTQQPQSFLNEYQIGGKDFAFEISAYPSRDGLSVFVKDITERKRTEEALKSVALETVEAVSSIVEANDPYTSGHSAMVTEIAIEIVQEMGLPDGQLDTLRVAGPLHDLGKVGIPSTVLNKPAGLTQAEWVMVQAHPQVSANVAGQVTAFQVAVPVIRHHHERWDGTGYPDRLKGDDIPLLARILAVADGFEAMTSERPYRRARTEEEALEELHKGAGTQWDPEVVKVFLKLRKPPTKRKGKGERKSGK